MPFVLSYCWWKAVICNVRIFAPSWYSSLPWRIATPAPTITDSLGRYRIFAPGAIPGNCAFVNGSNCPQWVTGFGRCSDAVNVGAMPVSMLHFLCGAYCSQKAWNDRELFPMTSYSPAANERSVHLLLIFQTMAAPIRIEANLSNWPVSYR